MTEPSLPEETLFAQALEIESTAERVAFLDRACGNDPALRAEVEALLHAHEQSGDLLDLPENLPVTTALPAREVPGTIIGPYKLLEQIGEGGMGTVWMTEQTEPIQRRVALKVVKEGMDSKQVLAHFEAERQALALMEHPNIAKVLDAGRTPSGRPYFVMELVKGKPITQYCDDKRLGVRERLELFGDICRAVQHAHQKGIIHRDLKPSNVLVAPYDGKPVVKVIDFGVAKATGQRLTDKTLFTGIGSLVGTPEYMSPEQAEVNNQDIDTRSDIYSLGVLLYELLTGSTPLTRKRMKEAALLEVLRVIREEEPPRPSTRLSESKDSLPSISAQRQTEPAKLTKLVRGELDWIVMKALEKDRTRRYETANGFAQDVQHYLADEAVQACPPSAGYRFRKFARRNKGRLVVSGVVLLLVVLLGATVGWTLRDKSLRRLHAAVEVEAAKDDVAQLRRQGKWAAALAVARRAEALLAGEGADPRLRQQFADLGRDLQMAADLEEIRLGRSDVKDGHWDWEKTDQAYAKAFGAYGIDVETLTTADAAERVSACTIGEELVAALDDWALERQLKDAEAAHRLRALARAADADPWRNRLREAVERRDVATLEQLAAANEVESLSSTSALRLADALFGANRWERALAVLRTAQQLHPDDLWLNHALAQNLQNVRPPQREEAVRFYSAALALRPQSPGINYNLALTLQEMGKSAEAVTQYRLVLQFKPDYAEAHTNLGIELRKLKKPTEAVVEYRRAVEAKPNLALAHFGLGQALEDIGKPVEAKAAYQQALKLDPGLAQNLAPALLQEIPGSRLVRARYFVSCNQLDRAAADYAQLDWTGPDLHPDFECACLLLIQGKSESYRQFCQRLIERAGQTQDPRQAYLLARSCAMARKGPVDPARAVAWGKQAYAGLPYAWHLHAQGLAEYRAGQMEQALKTLNQVDAGVWNFRELNWFAKALVHHALGHTDEARQCLSKGIQWMEQRGSKQLMACDWLEATVLRREAEELGIKYDILKAEVAAQPPPSAPSVGPKVAPGQELDLTGPTITGEKFDLRKLRGKIVLIDFWATWCGPCVAELPNVREVYDRYHADGFEVVGISLDNTREALAKFVKEKSVPGPQIFLGGDGETGWDNPLARKFGVSAIPATILVDRAGRVAQIGVRGPALGPAVAKLLGKEPPPLAAPSAPVQRNPAVAEAIALFSKGDLDGAIAAYRKAIALELTDSSWTHYYLGYALGAKGDLQLAVAEYREAIRLNPEFALAHCTLGLALQLKGEFRQALEALRRGDELGSKKPDWGNPSAQWVRECERLIELDGKLPDFLDGKVKPAGPDECIELAQLCPLKTMHRAAVRFYEEAFAAQPKLADNASSVHRYNAACAAALSGCGIGKDAEKLDDQERTRLRRQSLDWLRADLEAWGQRLSNEPDKVRLVINQKMRHWLVDTDFVGVRGPQAFAKLPEPEREAWQKLWDDVATTLAQTQAKPTPEKKSDVK